MALLTAIPAIPLVVEALGPGERDSRAEREAVLVGHGGDARTAGGADEGAVYVAVLLGDAEQLLHQVLLGVGAGDDALLDLVAGSEWCHKELLVIVPCNTLTQDVTGVNMQFSAVCSLIYPLPRSGVLAIIRSPSIRYILHI